MHTRFDEVFRISVILKGVDAALEIIGGLFLLIVTPHEIQSVVHSLTAKELSTDPHDFIATLIVHSTGHLTSGATRYAGIYLLAHGVIKMFVIVNVLRNKYWAYPTLIVVLFGFMVYQIMQLVHHASIDLIILTVFDGFVIVMTALEWQKRRALREATADSEGKPKTAKSSG